MWLIKLICHRDQQGWGLLKLRSLISPLREILIKQKYKSDNFNHVHICQVSPQLSWGDTCQIWTWYHTGNHCFDHSEKWENNGTEKIGLVTPTPVARIPLYTSPMFHNAPLCNKNVHICAHFFYKMMHRWRFLDAWCDLWEGKPIDNHEYFGHFVKDIFSGSCYCVQQGLTFWGLMPFISEPGHHWLR